jgi:hypothetical protein
VQRKRHTNARLPTEHRKVLRTLVACRTGELGVIHYQCPSCGASHVMGRSCGNRHCPTCQQDKTKAWLEKQISRLVPCPYFLIRFTVPEKLLALRRATFATNVEPSWAFNGCRACPVHDGLRTILSSVHESPIAQANSSIPNSWTVVEKLSVFSRQASAKRPRLPPRRIFDLNPEPCARPPCPPW